MPARIERAKAILEAIALGGGEGSLDLSDPTPVKIGIAWERDQPVAAGAVYVNQNQYEGEDAALHGAAEVFEEQVLSFEEWAETAGPLEDYGSWDEMLSEFHTSIAAEVFTFPPDVAFEVLAANPSSFQYLTVWEEGEEVEVEV